MSEFLETTVDKFIFRVADRPPLQPRRRVAAGGRGGRVRLGLTDYFQQRNGDVALFTSSRSGRRWQSGTSLRNWRRSRRTSSLFCARRRNAR